MIMMSVLYDDILYIQTFPFVFTLVFIICKTNNGYSLWFLYKNFHFYIDNGMRNIFIDKRMTNYRDENKERETYLLGEKVVMIKHDHDFVIMFTMISLYNDRLLWLEAQLWYNYEDYFISFDWDYWRFPNSSINWIAL